MTKDVVGSAMVVGSGISGIQAALDLADAGFRVYLLEKDASIGGVMAQLDKTFPTNDCSMCILAPKLVSVARHPNIKIITNAEIEKVSGLAGSYFVTIKKKARFVDETKCTGCGLCMANCPVRQVIQLDGEDSKLVVQLSHDDRERVDEIFKSHEKVRNNIMSILHTVNENYNYLPNDILRCIAAELDIPLSEVYNIATFYNSFSLVPKGRHTIAICRGTACHVRGSARILDRLEQELGIVDGETTDDLRFTLRNVRCIGCCSIAPAVRIDRETYGNVRPNQIGNLLRKYK
jgi:NADH:ubiquinone oxidoreductase subunit E/NAD-dependent dihydropyrimidine dehydrogenase PreA subunit